MTGEETNDARERVRRDQIGLAVAVEVAGGDAEHPRACGGERRWRLKTSVAVAAIDRQAARIAVGVRAARGGVEFSVAVEIRDDDPAGVMEPAGVERRSQRNGH